MASDPKNVTSGVSAPKIQKRVEFCFKEPLPVELTRKLTHPIKSVLKKDVPVAKESEKIGLEQINSSSKDVSSKNGTVIAGKVNDQDKNDASHRPQGSEQELCSSNSSSSGSTHIVRSYKEITELIKNLHKATDGLLEKSCQLHCKFAESIVKAATLFDPSIMSILNGGKETTGGFELGKPSEEYLKSSQEREVIDKKYAALTERLEYYKPNGSSLK